MREGIVEAVGKRAAFVGLYVLAALVGRASVVDGEPTALVWPAGGLAVAWLLTRPSMRSWLIDLPIIAVVTVAVTLLGGRSVEATAVLLVSNLVAVVSVVFAVRWWCPEAVRRGIPPATTPRAMAGFLAAVAAGALLGVATGGVGLVLIGYDTSLASLLVWFGRNVCGIAAVAITILLIIDRIRHGRRTGTAPTGSWLELTALFAITGALVATDYASDYPVAFLLPAAAVWAGSRFAALPVAVHAVVGGMGVLLLTYSGHGPFSAVDTERTNILLAQLFTAMTLAIGLVLAAAREARAVMSQELLTFARRVAHDLRNPISVVESWTAELETTLASSPQGPPAGTPMMVAGIERATLQMRTLVEGLLADAAAWNRAPTPLVVDLPDLVTEVAAAYGASDGVTTLGVRAVSGDPVLLRQLLDNLVANALKYSRPDVPVAITVSAHESGSRVVVRVTDNGVGIPDGAHEWIFEPFRRAHSNAYPGTGLGLSTCRRIVERHGGSLRALPREDGRPGSVFEFDLPSARVAQRQPALMEVSA